MDGARFDRFAKALARRASRRAALSLAAGLTGLIGVGETAARRKKHRKPCPVCKKRKHGKCKPVKDGTTCGTCEVCRNGACGAAPDGTDCGGGKVCAGGVCGCPGGQTPCNGACVDLATDPANCGRCGLSCLGGSCVRGVCDCGGGCPKGCLCFNGVDRAGCQFFQGPTHCDSDADCAIGSICIANTDPAKQTCGVPCCSPDCAGKTCGADGCGGTCGDCPSGADCQNGQCVCAAGSKQCGQNCIDNGFCCTNQDCAAGQTCFDPGHGRCCVVSGENCPAATAGITCCTGRCGDRGTSEGKCCIPAGEPCAGSNNCCNGNNACQSQVGGSVCA